MNGFEVDRDEQLRRFAGISRGRESGDVTMLGLMDSLPGEAGDEFDVAPAGEFECELQGTELKIWPLVAKFARLRFRLSIRS